VEADQGRTLWHRYALSFVDRKKGGPPTRRLLSVFLVCGVLFLAVGGLMASETRRRSLIARDWVQATATITAITDDRHVKGGRGYHLRLRAEMPDGHLIDGWTVAQHVVYRRLERPDPRVAVGETLAALMDPEDPQRMVSVTSMATGSTIAASVIFGGAGVIAIVSFLGCLTARRIVLRRG